MVEAEHVQDGGVQIVDADFVRLKAHVRKNGGTCTTTTADGMPTIGIEGLPTEWVSKLSASWRKQIAQRNETTQVEQLDNVPL